VDFLAIPCKACSEVRAELVSTLLRFKIRSDRKTLFSKVIHSSIKHTDFKFRYLFLIDLYNLSLYFTSCLHL
jgi:hypothetical protein